MICQRSGWCCIGLEVVIIMKDEEGNYGYYAKRTGIRCPHLRFEGETASCAVHDEPWYKNTPCYAYQNSELDPDYFGKDDKPCKMGPHMKQHSSLPVYGQSPPDKLLYLGPALVLEEC